MMVDVAEETKQNLQKALKTKAWIYKRYKLEEKPITDQPPKYLMSSVFLIFKYTTPKTKATR